MSDAYFLLPAVISHQLGETESAMQGKPFVPNKTADTMRLASNQIISALNFFFSPLGVACTATTFAILELSLCIVCFDCCFQSRL